MTVPYERHQCPSQDRAVSKDELLHALEAIHDTICDIGRVKGRIHNRAIQMVETLQARIEQEGK